MLERKTYEQWLNNRNMSYSEIQNMIMKICPKTLVRYRSFNKEYSIKEIVEGDIHLSYLNELNDPFEGAFNIDKDRYYTENRVLSAILKTLGTSGKRRMDEVWDISLKICEEQFEQYKKKIRIACFTESPNDMLMWSYYADGHKGYCIYYDTEWILANLGKFFLLPVVYSENMYDATEIILSANRNLSLNPGLFKGDAWNRENEWRLMTYKPEKEKNDLEHFYVKEAIKRVDIGCLCEKDEEIIEWCKECGILVYKRYKSKYKFELLEERVK